MIKQSALSLLLAAASVSGFAQGTPEGLWRSIDDDSGKPKAEIRIVANAAGVLTGKVEKALIESKEPLCTACTDARKDKPKVGMEIIRGAKKSDSEAVWEDGNILDPENGKTYTLRMAPLEGGRKLQVRGYIGPFYRTQVWQRIE
ncbi:DUF2147 domain-containing protein [Hydrogenophaga sp. PAMC20947]|uniref:DUF2147 domain-containing protein n=1 Tax=Hydrogenophaga sp. PAMC20947 TaxID=2565558 RepID=UPI001B353D0D|nr:DUF2147 domain-containing protein [Hydrogenophaga sp. PAMC20947]